MQLQFTMDNPDWGSSNMKCTIAGSNIVIPSGSYGLYPHWDTETHHPVVIGQMSITSDIVLHFGSDDTVDEFINQAGVTIGLDGRVLTSPTDPRYSFREYGVDTEIQFETHYQKDFCTLPILCIRN